MRKRQGLSGLLILIIGCQLLASGCRSRTEPRSPAAGSDRIAALAREADLHRRARAHALYATAVVHEINDRPAEAMEAFREAVRLDAANEDLTLDVSRRFLQHRKPDAAIAILEPHSLSTNASAPLLTQLAFSWWQVGQKDKARAVYERAVARDPAFYPALQQLFAACVEARQWADAKAALDRAALTPDLPPFFLIGLGELYVALSVQDPNAREACRSQALTVLSRAEALRPQEIPLRLALADHLNALGESQRAAQIYVDVLKELPIGADFRERLHAKLTELYLRNNDPDRADEQLQAIIRADPTNPQAYYFLGVIAMERKQPEKAIEYFQKTILLKPEIDQAYFDLANAQLSANKAEDALATLARVRQAFPASFLLEYLTAVAYARQERYPQALPHYRTAESLAQAKEPKRLNHYFYFQFGAASERNGDFSEAEVLFEKALAIEPDFPEALNYLGYMWADRGTNLDRARELIERALKAEPENDAFLDSMGWVLFRLQRPKEALPYLLKAAELAEKPDPTVYDHLGDVYAALGETEKAREYWRKSLAVEESKEVRMKLETEPPGEIR